ncbi:MAG TPA: two-component regulator propeller domain-containing protein, partial [Rudaea sp.]
SALTVLADRKNDVWIGTLNGLTRLRGDAARQFSTADGLTSDYVASLAASFDGGLWLGLRGNVVDHLREGRVDRHIALKPPLLSSVVTALIEDERHQLWIGTNGAGVAQYASDGLHYFTNGDGLAENSINTIAPDRGDAVWVGTANGLWRIDAGRVDANPLHDARTAHLSILAVYEDGAGVLWLGTQAHGLLRVDRGALTFYGREQGLPNDTINSILGDESGNLWLGSNRGVLRLAREQIDAVAAGRRDRFDVMQFGEGDGMKTAETSSGSQPSAWRGSDGRLWFVSGVGVVVADPKRIRRDTRALRPLIESVRADDAAVDFSDAELRLPAGLARLEIHYTAPNLTAANSMRFRYRLSDFDDSWSYVGNERVARYVNLPPGAHRFDLQVRRADEDWSAAGESLRFYVEPAFYETNTFLVLAVLSAIAVLWTLYYLRVQWLRMESAVADERRRLAGEIHDSLAQGFSAISVQIEAALGRMQRAPELAVTHLKLASDVSRSSLSEARRSIWNLQARSSDAGGMAAMIDAACEQILYGHDTRLHVAMHGKPWRANPSIEHNLVRIAQEAVANAIQHGRAREISTELRYDFARLTLSIRDDGIGYDGGAPRPAEGDRGYGLQNMRLRAHAMHGELSIQSAPGVGTRIDVVVPRVAFLRLAQRRSGAVR